MKLQGEVGNEFRIDEVSKMELHDCKRINVEYIITGT